MEKITLTAATASSEVGEVLRLWIGQEEVPTGERSLAQWLEGMSRQGWQLTSSYTNVKRGGSLGEYRFQRPKAPLLVEEEASPTPAHAAMLGAHRAISPMR
jgi:hypothetical protein